MKSKEPNVVGSFVSLLRGTTYKGSLLGEDGPYLLGLASIQRNGGFRSDSLKRYSGETSEKLLLYPRDIFVSLKDVTQSADLLGAVARVPNEISVGRLTQDTVKLIFDGEKIPHGYLYWLLRTQEYRNYCKSHATGTTNLGLSREDFLSFPVPEFNKFRQLIVEALEAVESKIELNRQINQTLEHIAQTIFKSWFVDFEPVKAKIEAKAAGRDPERSAMCAISGKTDAELDQLPPDQRQQLAATAALFPDEFMESELGLIPKEWEVSKIGNEVTVCGGGTPSTANPNFWDGNFAWITPKDLSQQTENILITSERTISESGVNKISSGQLPIGTVLLSSRAPIGYLALSMIPVSINQGFIAMICNKRLPNTYVLQWSTENLDAIKQRGSGTTFAEISKSTFRPMPVLVPCKEALIAFQTTVEPLYAEITAKAHESRTLATLRDSLLPKLLSGELPVSAIGDVSA
jgi:restriction endonuclease S subunit